MSSDARGDRGQDQSSEQQQRPLKRIRQACEPCRRKKSRCTGEKPVCALCERLGQGSRCTYAPDRSDGPRLSGSPTPAVDVNLQHNTSDRLNVLEQGMARVQDLLRELARGPATPLDRESLVAPIVAAQVAPVGGAGFAAGSSRGVGVGAGGGGGDAEDSVAELDKAERLYTTFCDCQPLPLFATGCLALRARVKELQLAVILLVSRFAGGWSLVGANSAQIMQRVRSRVMQTLLDGPVELATLQTMCLLSLVEFNDGSTARASFYSSTAMDLAQSAGLASEHPRSSYKDLEERRRCYWSLILLKNLYGNMAGKSSFIPHDFTPKHPTSTEPPSRSISSITEPGLPQPDPSPGSAPVAEKDLGMLAYVISMTDLWAKVVRYARRRGKSQQPPPWAPEAEYQRIMAELMVLETQMPYKYRFKPARFGDYSTAELQQSRTFWSPWFLNQMLYHSLLSLLNHPLILSLQLRNFKMNQVPEVFLQHTDDLTQTHTNWVVHLVDQITSKDFQPSDPYPAYCVAIVATIFLQQSYADDDQIRSTKQDNFARCLAFIRQLGSYWPRVAQLADKVDQFQQLVAASRDAAAPDGKTYIDLRLFWDIVESCFTTELPTGPDAYFGASLLSHRAAQSEDVVNGHLLPRPTRLDFGSSRGPSVANTPNQQRFPVSMTDQTQYQAPPFPSVDDQLSVLAQSYFAQGQDFVNLDDWWYPEQGV